jgi:hypothetical protein
METVGFGEYETEMLGVSAGVREAIGVELGEITAGQR